MRKFYSIVNVLAFVLVIYYVTSNTVNEQVKHGTIVMGVLSLLMSGYMTFYEYTDDSDQKHQSHIEQIKTTYKGKIDEYDTQAKTLHQRERFVDDIQEENKKLVNDVVQTKKIVTKLTDIIEQLENPAQQPPPRFNDEMTPNPADNNYHMENPNKRSVSNVDQNSGPPAAMVNTQDDFDLDARLKEYDSVEFGKPAGAPPIPDFLKSANTSKRDDANMMSAY